jgi:metal-responsive CopG/Arc/MetJ family transcriptional regulator
MKPKTSRPVRGRPVTVGATVPITAKVPPALAKTIDEFAARTGKGRSDAIRQLIEAGLKRRRKPTRAAKSS